MRKITLLLLFAIGFSGAAFAQNDARFTHYQFNQLYFNPGYAGLDPGARFQYLGRAQWLGYSADGGNAPVSHVLSANVPLLRANMGIGGYVFYETMAATTALSVNVPVSYHLNVGGGKLTIGLMPGIYSQGRDANKYRAVDPGDTKIPASINSMQFDLGAGVYYKSQRLFAGISSTHILEPKFKFAGNGQSAETGMLRHYYGIVGYNFEVSPTITLTPNVLYKSTFKKDGGQAEGGITATFNNKFWVGLNYAEAEAGSAIVGLSLLRDNSLRFSYAMDLVMAGQEAKKPTSHELMLSYTLPVALKGPKPAVRTPRYRK